MEGPRQCKHVRGARERTNQGEEHPRGPREGPLLLWVHAGRGAWVSEVPGTPTPFPPAPAAPTRSHQHPAPPNFLPASATRRLFTHCKDTSPCVLQLLVRRCRLRCVVTHQGCSPAPAKERVKSPKQSLGLTCMLVVVSR